MTNLRTLLLGTALASALATQVFGGISGPEPGNLSGTWAGEMKCKLFDGSETFTLPLEGALYVRHEGTEVALVTDLFLVGGETMVTPQGEPVPGIIGTMCGVALPKKPENPAVGVGTISPVGAGGNIITPREGELQVVALKTKTFEANSEGETGKLTGKGILLPASVIGSCRWKFARVSTDPVPVDPSFCQSIPG
jgi:hypothetical protein